MIDFEMFIALILHAAGALILFLLFFRLLKFGSFGILFAVSFSAYFIGLYIYPIFDILGLIGESGVLIYERGSSSLQIGSAFHALLFAVGIVLGFQLKLFRFDQFVIRKADIYLVGAVEKRLMFALILIGGAAYSLLYALVGFDVVMANSASSRGGNFDGFAGNTSFLFLKTIGASCMLSGAIFVYLLITKSRFFIAIYLVLVVLSYLHSVSRSIFLANIIMPGIVYLLIVYSRKGGVAGIAKVAVPAAVLLIISFVILQYGKVFGIFTSLLFSGDGTDYDFVAAGETTSRLLLVLNSFSYIWYSVNSGIENFLDRGMFFTYEPILAILFGWMPSGVLEMVGLGGAYYGNLSWDQRLACINSEYFINSNGCTVPPLISGYSAYFLPFGGALLAGLFIGTVVLSLRYIWNYYEINDSKRLWVPYFLLLSFFNFITIIPSANAYTFFSLMMTSILARFIWSLSRFKLN